MEQFYDSVKRSWQYPTNSIGHEMYAHSLNTYVERLNEHKHRVFSARPKAPVDVLECKDQGHEFNRVRIHDLCQLKKSICTWGPDPRSRFVFVGAPNSRDNLNITREMLSLLFTYLQVMPAFLDFVLTFGKRIHAQEFPFSGFRYHKRLDHAVKGVAIDALRRSGQDLRLCYNLRSVELSELQKDWPWSIRQTAVHHSFDTITARATWIIIKADQLMEDRIMSAAKPFGESAISSFDTNSRAFAAALATHLIVLDWSGENWHWYIDFLEDEAQRSTRRSLAIEVEKPPPVIPPTTIKPISRTTTLGTQSSFRPTGNIYTKTDPDDDRPRTPPGVRRACTDRLSTRMQHPGDAYLMSYDHSQPDKSGCSNDGFSFSDLQRIHFLEEKTNETILVIESNLNVLLELVQFYQPIVDSEECPGELRLHCKADVKRFTAKAKSIENDLRMQQSRARSLLRMLEDRRGLLYGILEYRSLEASRSLAQRAQLSSDSTEVLTRDMHEIAQKTKQETVSMRIITLVTLFFLPGTFISTVMSTDIIHFGSEDSVSDPSKKMVSVKALELYMAITLPLMVITFGAWYGVYWWVNKRERHDDEDVESGLSRFSCGWESLTARCHKRPAHVSNPRVAKRLCRSMQWRPSTRKGY